MTLYQQSNDNNSIRQNGFNVSSKTCDKPETASDFAVPDIKPSYRHQ